MGFVYSFELPRIWALYKLVKIKSQRPRVKRILAIRVESVGNKVLDMQSETKEQKSGNASIKMKPNL